MAVIEPGLRSGPRRPARSGLTLGLNGTTESPVYGHPRAEALQLLTECER